MMPFCLHIVFHPSCWCGRPLAGGRHCLGRSDLPSVAESPLRIVPAASSAVTAAALTIPPRCCILGLLVNQVGDRRPQVLIQFPQVLRIGANYPLQLPTIPYHTTPYHTIQDIQLPTHSAPTVPYLTIHAAALSPRPAASGK